ncbi:hypothetical protein [uncultured Akkermansia sp.]|uniref:hypothetical protein n=1 Tax=uncultured Akkermansia sp. TaxID=512294 RepID=UPI0025EC1C14|nr:hypothetical protein [uncultured Akkermansia sp.]
MSLPANSRTGMAACPLRLGIVNQSGFPSGRAMKASGLNTVPFPSKAATENVVSAGAPISSASVTEKVT